jgi:hypothetical protein
MLSQVTVYRCVRGRNHAWVTPALYAVCGTSRLHMYTRIITFNSVKWLTKNDSTVEHR